MDMELKKSSNLLDTMLLDGPTGYAPEHPWVNTTSTEGVRKMVTKETMTATMMDDTNEKLEKKKVARKRKVRTTEPKLGAVAAAAADGDQQG